MVDQALPMAQQDTPSQLPADPATVAQPQAPLPANMQPPQGTQGRPPPQAAAVPVTPQPGAQATVQSEATPQVTKPTIDPRPYAWLAEHAPAQRAMVDQAADQAGISPQRLAAHWNVESKMNMASPDGKAGEQGVMQIMPTTAQQYNLTQNGKLDPSKPQDSLDMGAQLIRRLDNAYGRDSISSVAAYQGGPGSANDIAANPDKALQNHPTTMAYAQKMFPGTQITPAGFTGQGSLIPQDLVKAGVQGGPEGALKYITQTAPAGMSMTDAWQHAEGSLTTAFLERGDIAGAQHARDYILQLSHAGSNSNLMAAHQALTAGDGIGAANYLAKAHAFFPDSTMGQFSVDSKGNVWAYRMDEHDPTRQIGSPFQVTPQSIASTLNQTRDPGKYLQMVMEQQKQAADIRHQDVMGNYYSGLLQSRENIASGHDQTRENVADLNNQSREGIAANRNDTTLTVADMRNGRQGQGPMASLSKTADAETGKTYSEDAMPDSTPAQRSQMADVHHDARMQGANPATAEYAAKGLADKTLALIGKTPDGRYVVGDKKQQPVAYISKELGDRLSGNRPAAPEQAPSPVGSASGVMRAASGTGVNLAGVVQSSAIPTAPPAAPANAPTSPQAPQPQQGQ